MQSNVIDLAKELIAIPSVSRWSNIDISDFIASWLEQAGFDTIERLEYTYKNDERKVNLVAKKGEGQGGLAFLAHSDTVDGMEDAWDAFTPVVQGGNLYGRGSCDMKGPIAAAMIASASVDKAQISKPVYLVVTADEEIGLYGAKHVARHSDLLLNSQPDYGIVIEPTSLVPGYAHKGYVMIHVTAHGEAAHTSTDTGQSASFLLAPFLAEMAELKRQFRTDRSYMNEAFQPPTNGFNMIFSDDGATNITASTAQCSLTLRAMPDARYEEIMQYILNRAEFYGFETKSGLSHPVYTDIDSPLVQGACDATDTTEPKTFPYGTDGFHFQGLMPLIILGPGDINLAHTVGEYIPIEELERSVSVYQKLIKTLCS